MDSLLVYIEPTTKPLKEYPADQRPPIERRIDYIISQVEASNESIESAWYEIDQERLF